jgi:hypothetical protein
LLSPASQEFTTANGTARVQWTLRPTRPGTYTDNFQIQLLGVDGCPLDSHTLLLSVDEASAHMTLSNGQAGTLTTTLGSAQLEVPQQAFAGALGRTAPLGQENIDLHLLPISSAAAGSGFVRMGDAVYVVAAFHSGTMQPASMTGSAPTLTLRWDEAALPSFISAARLRVFMAENDRQWVALNSQVDVNARTVQAVIPRAGTFTIGWLDLNPPTAIQGLSATADENQVVLQWLEAAESDVVGYQVLARQEPGTPVVATYPIANPDTIQYRPTQHAPGVTRYYTVRALDMAGNLGSESAPIAVKRPGQGGADTVVLNIRLQDGAIIFSWPAEAEGYSLESTSHLPAENWNPVPINPVVIAGQQTVSRPASAHTQFFRLRKP